MPAEKHAAVEVDEIRTEPITEERDALGVEVEDDSARAHLDFLTSIILIIISIAVIITSIGYWQRQKVTFYESAGFMPVLIAGGLLIMSLRLLREALKQDSAHSFISRLKVSFGQTVHGVAAHRAQQHRTPRHHWPDYLWHLRLRAVGAHALLAGFVPAAGCRAGICTL